MAESDNPKSPVDQLIDLFVYAPVGFIYERDEMLDKVVTRGKSQVQIARLMAKMAAQKSDGPEAMVGEAISFAADTVAKGITDFGIALGLVPAPPAPTSSSATANQTPPAPSDNDTVDADVDDATDPAVAADVVEELSDTEPDTEPDTVVPIAGYDAMNARDIIAALAGLSLDDVEQVARYERATRNRKTVLAKTERLLS